MSSLIHQKSLVMVCAILTLYAILGSVDVAPAMAIPKPIAIYAFSKDEASIEQAPSTLPTDKGTFIAHALGSCLRQLGFDGLVVRGSDLDQVVKERVFQIEGPGRSVAHQNQFSGARSILTGSYRIEGGTIISLNLRAIDADSGEYFPLEYQSDKVEVRNIYQAIAQIARYFVEGEGVNITSSQQNILKNFSDQRIADPVWNKLNLDVCYQQSPEKIHSYLANLREKLVVEAGHEIRTILQNDYPDTKVKHALSLAAYRAEKKLLADKHKITPELITFTGRKRYARIYTEMVLTDDAMVQVLRGYGNAVASKILAVMNRIARETSFFQNQCYQQQIAYSFGPIYTPAFQRDINHTIVDTLDETGKTIEGNVVFNLADYKGTLARIVVISTGRYLSNSAAQGVAKTAGKRYLRKTASKIVFRSISPVQLLGDVTIAAGWAMICENIIHFVTDGLHNFLHETQSQFDKMMPQFRQRVIQRLQQQYINFLDDSISRGHDVALTRYKKFSEDAMALRKLTIQFPAVDEFVQTCREDDGQTVSRLIVIANTVSHPKRVIPILAHKHLLSNLSKLSNQNFQLAVAYSRKLPWTDILTISGASLVKYPMIILSSGNIHLLEFAFTLHPLGWSLAVFLFLIVLISFFTLIRKQAQ